jgi:hypothetical protein
MVGEEKLSGMMACCLKWQDALSDVYGLQFASGPFIVIKGRVHMPSLKPFSAQGSARSN